MECTQASKQKYRQRAEEQRKPQMDTIHFLLTVRCTGEATAVAVLDKGLSGNFAILDPWE